MYYIYVYIAIAVFYIYKWRTRLYPNRSRLIWGVFFVSRIMIFLFALLSLSISWACIYLSIYLSILFWCIKRSFCWLQRGVSRAHIHSHTLVAVLGCWCCCYANYSLCMLCKYILQHPIQSQVQWVYMVAAHYQLRWKYINEDTICAVEITAAFYSC